MASDFDSLPMEIILYIFDDLAGSPSGYFPLAYNATSTITRTLWSLTLVSKRISTAATLNLYSNCLYIDTEGRLDGLVRTVIHAAPSTLENIRSSITSLYPSSSVHGPISQNKLSTIPLIF
ncbi:hypothetical protein K432DRAFT_423971 [Lepidopterella palustris CBS 459.81]|uniref:F-box domain-containing protein n=1 Tax=Lepidopterella palustris CBS 459.81 TaxID=1314670 RepID=A0A8E2EF68_9PEZI|nr:hypothetical protein K432DRAFT_423971 [Lepidopterella palustris CBS 459.81]